MTDTNTKNTKNTTELFNINGTATLTVETDAGVRAHVIYVDGGRRCLFDVMPVERASNVKSAINYLLNEKIAVSVQTVDGLTVARGKGNDRQTA